MIISKIIKNQVTYINLHAEETVTANYINEDNIGVAGDRLQDTTMRRIIDSLLPEQKYIIFDFRYLDACQQNINKNFIKLKNDGYFLVFRNIKMKLVEDMSLLTITNSNNEIEDNGDFKTFYFFEGSNTTFEGFNFDAKVLFEEAFKRKLIPFVNSHSEPHTSSFVYLSSYVDVKSFFSKEQEFMLYSIYRLAMKIKKEWSDELKEEPILICQSLNSSFIVGILSTLLKLDILIIDKIGPINKLYNRLSKHILEKRKYIVVSDLVCLGTEVKIVKNLIEFIGGKYLGNVAIIKTETLSKKHIKKEDATKAVFSINRENNKELNYNIITDLSPLI